MNVSFPTTFLAASLFVVGIAAASAAEPAGVSPGPGAIKEKCKQDPAQCAERSRARFGERFKKLDTDGDGTVSKAEAEKGAPRMAEHFAEIDANKDGKLTPEEMQNAARARMERCKQDPEKCRAAMKQRFEADWKKADTDGDGSLSKAEAEKSMPRVAHHFDAIDTDKDGKISLAEMEAARARHRHHRGPKPVDAPHAALKVNS